MQRGLSVPFDNRVSTNLNQVYIYVTANKQASAQDHVKQEENNTFLHSFPIELRIPNHHPPYFPNWRKTVGNRFSSLAFASAVSWNDKTRGCGCDMNKDKDQGVLADQLQPSNTSFHPSHLPPNLPSPLPLLLLPTSLYSSLLPPLPPFATISRINSLAFSHPSLLP